jgi:hypothetical protein
MRTSAKPRAASRLIDPTSLQICQRVAKTRRQLRRNQLHQLLAATIRPRRPTVPYHQWYHRLLSRLRQVATIGPPHLRAFQHRQTIVRSHQLVHHRAQYHQSYHHLPPLDAMAIVDPLALLVLLDAMAIVDPLALLVLLDAMAIVDPLALLVLLDAMAIAAPLALLVLLDAMAIVDPLALLVLLDATAIAAPLALLDATAIVAPLALLDATAIVAHRVHQALPAKMVNPGATDLPTATNGLRTYMHLEIQQRLRQAYGTTTPTVVSTIPTVVWTVPTAATTVVATTVVATTGSIALGTVA